MMPAPDQTILRKYQLTRDRVQLQNRLEALLEEAHIKLSSLVSDLLGASARRMAEGARRRGNQPHGSGRFGRSSEASATGSDR